MPGGFGLIMLRYHNDTEIIINVEKWFDEASRHNW